MDLLDRVWPASQQLEQTAEKTIVLAHFADMGPANAALKARIMELEQDKEFCQGRFPGGCGIKVRDISRWNIAAAEAIGARACEMFKRVTGSKTAVVDESWASIYREGDFCMPHSHVRATGSIVYLLDPGDAVEGDDLGGRLCFCDPRIACCCQVKAGYMTNIFLPDMREGSMIIFPATAVHAVAPYRGKRPRITMSWNIAAEAIPGKPKRLR